MDQVVEPIRILWPTNGWFWGWDKTRGVSVSLHPVLSNPHFPSSTSSQPTVDVGLHPVIDSVFRSNIVSVSSPSLTL